MGDGWEMLELVWLFVSHRLYDVIGVSKPGISYTSMGHLLSYRLSARPSAPHTFTLRPVMMVWGCLHGPSRMAKTNSWLLSTEQTSPQTSPQPEPVVEWMRTLTEPVNLRHPTFRPFACPLFTLPLCSDAQNYGNTLITHPSAERVDFRHGGHCPRRSRNQLRRFARVHSQLQRYS